MFIPSQGFRHAAMLLLSSAERRIATEAAPSDVENALARLAEDIVALANDTHAPGDARDWLLAEYARTVDALPHRIDVAAALSNARAIFERVGERARNVERRDVFLIYAPEDRLPIAAPLAIELAKRRVTVAFSEFEVATREAARSAVNLGLARHRAGVILATPAFERILEDTPPVAPSDAERIRVVRESGLDTTDGLADWIRQVKDAPEAE
jgi:hypothetical protein